MTIRNLGVAFTLALLSTSALAQGGAEPVFTPEAVRAHVELDRKSVV